MKSNRETREQLYTNIINLAGTPSQESYDKPWAQHPRILDRALALADLSLKRYREQDNQLAISDAEWVTSKIQKHIKKGQS